MNQYLKMVICKMNWYKKAQEIYRGDTNPIDLEQYDPEYGVKMLGKELGSSAAAGPGIYFTGQEDIAQMYGSNITKRNLNNANILTEQSPLFNHKQINKMLMSIDPEILKTAISNWDEDYNRGKRILIESIVNANNPIEQLMNIWAEVFFHQNPNSFIELMTKNRIDGISKQKKEDETYYVIYNKAILQ